MRALIVTPRTSFLLRCWLGATLTACQPAPASIGARVAAHEPADLKPILFPQHKPLRPEVTTLAILDSPSETHGPRAVVRRWFEAIEQESNAELSDVLSDSAVLIRPNKDPASALLVWIRRFAALDYSTSRAAVIAAPSRIALVDHEAYRVLNGVRELRLEPGAGELLAIVALQDVAPQKLWGTQLQMVLRQEENGWRVRTLWEDYAQF